jgi:hypothetical protein
MLQTGRSRVLDPMRFFSFVETPFYLQAVYIHSATGVRIGCYGLGRGTQ